MKTIHSPAAMTGSVMISRVMGQRYSSGTLSSARKCNRIKYMEWNRVSMKRNDYLKGICASDGHSSLWWLWLICSCDPKHLKWGKEGGIQNVSKCSIKYESRTEGNLAHWFSKLFSWFHQSEPRVRHHQWNSQWKMEHTEINQSPSANLRHHEWSNFWALAVLNFLGLLAAWS